MSKKAETDNKPIYFKGKFSVYFLKTIKMLAFLVSCLGVVVIAVCVIYYIEDDDLQNIILPIVAAIFGGICTLLGVAWTIKKGDADRKADLKRIDDERKREEQKRHIPYIRLAPGYEAVHTAFVTDVKHYDFESFIKAEKITDNRIYIIKIDPFIIKNVSLSTIILCGIYIDDRFFPLASNELVECNGICQIQFEINRWYPFTRKIQSITLVVSDILKNRYTITCKLYASLDDKPFRQTASNQVEYSTFSYKCTVESLSLPKLQEEDFINE